MRPGKPLSGYLPFLQWTAGDSNPDFLGANQVSSLWTSGPHIQEVRSGIEPDLPPYRGGVLRHDVLSVARLPVAPLGHVLWPVRELNPAFPADHAAHGARAGVLSDTRSSRRGGNRTLAPVLIRDLLSPLSYAPVGPKGFEPSLAGLKVRCAAVTPRPRNAGRVYTFPSCLLHR